MSTLFTFETKTRFEASVRENKFSDILNQGNGIDPTLSMAFTRCTCAVHVHGMSRGPLGASALRMRCAADLSLDKFYDFLHELETARAQLEVV